MNATTAIAIHTLENLNPPSNVAENSGPYANEDMNVAIPQTAIIVDK